MKKLVAISLLIAVVAVSLLVQRSVSSQEATWKAKSKRGDAVRALVVTGGHDHDSEFYSVFDDENIKAVVDPHPAVFGGDIRKRADVLVLYDMMKTLDEKRRKNLQAFVENGKGVVVLHHAIGDNVDWPWWYEEVVGGRYLFEPVNGKAGSYKHDVDLTIKPAMQHPILKGITPFHIHDETYKNLWISPKVKVLLTTDNPTSDGPVAWISPYEKSRVVYIQLGHDRNANLNPNWQRLVRNAIQWAAGRL
ncbi:MAG: ThuA domain-containing protein [Acidobacteriota bacterium]|nr:ThuA domain-containing protein [Acidobacteriota bacterium]